MSATGRNNEGNERRADDAYMTPGWCVRRLMEVLARDLPAGRWLEPAAGTGNIIAHARPWLPGDAVAWTAIELRQECGPALHNLDRLVQTVMCPIDFLAGEALVGPGSPRWGPRWDVAITNPPFSRAFEFYQRMRLVADHTVLLTRLNFLASKARAEAFRNDAPNVFVLPNRPSFTGGGTDATEYAWLHWPPERRLAGSVQVLASSTQEERAAAATQHALGPTP